MDDRWQQIERIYHAARGVEKSAREEVVAAACAEDPSLGDEVKFLLEKADQAGSFLQTPAIEVAAEALAKEKLLSDPRKPAFEPGFMIAHYRLAGKIGEGGMGEVYRASDTRLQRDVALKILPQAFARDAERMARFEREAQVLASLNHPNIAAIHGLEESSGIRALVMELVEGETLAERLGRIQPSPHGPSPQRRGRSGGAGSGEGSRGSLSAVDNTLHIAKQIAEALEYAHERGVVHRDLKPANVKITPEGMVKVLDFGLAKVLNPQESSAGSDPAHSPALSANATQPGMLLGTASYMSPEQARGLQVDRRCDIWAFGCVLYELISAQKAFEGETASDVLAAVITKEPDWNSLPATTPPSVQKLIHRCLVKDPRQRMRDIGEARIAIEETQSGSAFHPSPLQSGEGGPGKRDRVRASPLRRTLPWAIGGLLVATLITAALLWKFAAPTPQEFPVSFYISPPPKTTLREFGFNPGPVAVSPDGGQLAFSATDENGITRLYVRHLASEMSQVVAGTEDAAWPFWSPDGGSLAFFADQKLKTVNLANGNLEVLADSSCPDGGAWGPGGTILFTPRCQGPIYSISHLGGSPNPVTQLGSSEAGQHSPAFLPDGRHFLYVAGYGGSTSESVWMAAIGSSENQLVLKNAGYAQFASGHLLFFRENRVFAQSFNSSTGALAGDARAIVDAQTFSVSGNGVLAYQGGTMKGRLEWFDRSGNPLGSIGPVAEYQSARISPDGARILADIVDPTSNSWDLWSYPAGGGPGTRLTFGPGTKTFSVWSPDGRYIAYSCHSDGKLGICRKPADGSGQEEKLLTFNNSVSRANVVDWSPDGRYISFNRTDIEASNSVTWVLPLLGDRKPFKVAPVNAPQYDGVFSPDGRWLACFSFESGRSEVYVVSFPKSGGKFQISQNGGWLARWDRKGHFYFLSGGNRLMEADLTTSGASVHMTAIRPLFQLNLPSYPDPLFDVNGDGSRFLVITSAEPDVSGSIGVLLDWESRLKGKE